MARAHRVVPALLMVLVRGTGADLSCCRADDPLTIVILCDMSASMGGPFGRAPFSGDPRQSGSAVRQLIRVLEPHDLVAPARFGERVLIGPFTVPNFSELAAAFDRVRQFGGPSPAWDGLNLAVTRLARSPGRRVIFLITDGKVSANAEGFAFVMGRAVRESVTVSALHVVLEPRTELTADSPGVRLQALAAATGGTYMQIRGAGIPGAIARLIPALRGRR
jgi:hypothetical protein